MKIIVHEEEYKAVVITGPSHCLLSLEFGDTKNIVVEALKPVSGTASGISREWILTTVCDALAEWNQCYGESFMVKVIRYVPDDTKSRELYSQMVMQICNKHLDRLRN